ncbi:MAG: hypothetical protein ACKKMS_01335 [Candidatus Nealsonbacteria bacterium]
MQYILGIAITVLVLVTIVKGNIAPVMAVVLVENIKTAVLPAMAPGATIVPGVEYTKGELFTTEVVQEISVIPILELEQAM